MRPCFCLAVAFAFAAALGAKEAEEDIKLLRNAGCASDDRALLDIFRQRTLSDADRTRIVGLVRQLDDDDFEVRESAQKQLTELGKKALPALHRAAESPSQEVRNRAQRCLNATGKDVPVEALRAAVRLLGSRRPADTIPVLFEYLPEADDEQLQHDILQTLTEMSAKGGAELKALAERLRDPHPQRRRVAVLCLGRSPKAEDRALVRKLLDDADVTVRWQAAEALLGGADGSGVPTMLALLEEAPIDLAISVEEVLQSLAGPTATNESLDLANKEARKKCRAFWEAWWKANQEKIDLARWSAGPRLVGLTVICETADPEGVSRVWECGRNGKPRWKIPVRNPICVEVLSQGRVLVADCVNEGQVVEYDRQGRVLWSHRVPSPVSCQRLPNGNTLIATQTKILEVSRAGREQEIIRSGKHLHWAHALPSGNVAYLHSDGFLTVIRKGLEKPTFIRSLHVGDARTWGSFQALAEDRFLVCLYSANKVVELDGDGKVQWDLEVSTPTCAIRLPNGNTLVSVGKEHRVVEFNNDGKQVWEQETQGRPYGIVRR
jgi:hypothetical protein